MLPAEKSPQLVPEPAQTSVQADDAAHLLTLDDFRFPGSRQMQSGFNPSLHFGCHTLGVAVESLGAFVRVIRITALFLLFLSF